MREIEERAARAYHERFGDEPAVIASAPGRVNLIGEHTDYNEGFVLPLAIERRVAVAAGEGTNGLYSIDYGEAAPADGCPGDGWPDYPRGIGWALAEAGYGVPPAQMVIHGDVPQGAGLSSSAAIEAATILALSTLAGLDIDRRRLALLCQRADHGFVGVKSGIMDQYASLLCRRGAALLIDCRSLEARPVSLPLAEAGLTLLVCDTRVERRLVGSAYNERRAACERAAATLGLDSLRDATPEMLTRLQGEELRRARHVVTENERVLVAVDALERGDFATVGELMDASHASLRDDYQVSVPELDVAVETARTEGALGARLTGAGFGGCAIALVPEERAGTVEDAIRTRFAQRGFTEPEFYRLLPADGAEIARDG